MPLMQKKHHIVTYLLDQVEYGKRLIAKEFAKMILCLDEKKYCNKCKSCIEFNSNNNPDFSIIQPTGGSVKIDQIRDVQKRVVEKPIISKRKVYIFDDADLMTNEAQNCLLKTLEEPPEYVTIILIGTNESDFLETIKSRCMIMHFKKINDISLKKYIETVYKDEHVSNSMLKIFDGSIGKVVNLRGNNDLYKEIEQIIKSMEKSDIVEFLKNGEILYNAKDNIYDILEYINVLLLDKSKQNYIYANCIEVIENTRKRMKSNSNYNMCIDYMLFNMWEEVNEKYSRS